MRPVLAIKRIQAITLPLSAPCPLSGKRWTEETLFRPEAVAPRSSIDTNGFAAKALSCLGDLEVAGISENAAADSAM
jgi:hypothetical protein